MAAAAIANIVKSSLGPVGLDKMLVDDIGVCVPLRSDCQTFVDSLMKLDSSCTFCLLILVFSLCKRMWPSPTMGRPSWSCWKWSTQLPRSSVNWLTCRTRRSGTGPRLWWDAAVSSPQRKAGAIEWYCPRTFSIQLSTSNQIEVVFLLNNLEASKTKVFFSILIEHSPCFGQKRFFRSLRSPNY